MKGTVYPRPHAVDPKTGAKRPVKGSTWTWAFSVPKAGGGRRQISKGGYSTRKACEEALAEALVAHGRSPAPKPKPSKDALSTYLTEVWLPALHDLKPSTRKGYADLVNAYLIPHLGDVRLCDLTTEQVVRFYDTLRTSGRRRPSKSRPDDRGLSESTVHHVHVCLSAALAYAVESRHLEVSPLASMAKRARPKASSGDKPELKAWTPTQARAFLASAADDRLSALFELALHTGMRRGELVALRWEDVALDRGVIAVRRNRVTVGYDVEEGTPKSRRARTIDIDEPMAATLRAHRRRQLEDRLAWGEDWQDHGLVFTREERLTAAPTDGALAPRQARPGRWRARHRGARSPALDCDDRPRRRRAGQGDAGAPRSLVHPDHARPLLPRGAWYAGRGRRGSGPGTEGAGVTRNRPKYAPAEDLIKWFPNTLGDMTPADLLGIAAGRGVEIRSRVADRVINVDEFLTKVTIGRATSHLQSGWQPPLSGP